MTELRNVEADLAQFRTRVLAAGLAVLVAFALLAARMVYLQVMRHDDLLAQAESNRTAVLPVVPNRGQILDRHGRVLATNYSAYTLEITPAKVDDLDATIEALGQLVDIQPRDKRRFRKLREESRSFDSLPIRTRLSDEEVARFTVQRYRFPGVDVRARLLRSYPNGEVASHVIGYIGRINQREKESIEEWPDEEQANYRGTEHIGKLGAEQSYERELHGITGFERVETSAGGRAVRSLANTPATPGNTVVLAIDIQLQKLVEDMFGERRGALVAIDPRNGEVLAFVSKPTFDPNLFVEGIDTENWKLLNESLDKPLLNRALRGTYPPGSTYKPFMALGALEIGTRSASTVINDPGYWMFGNHRFRSHGDGGLGAVDMYRSIVKSSNTYYYSLANEMGVDTMHDFMKPLGFGQITGLDLKGEVRGVLPSTDWKRSSYKRPEQQRWYAGETISLGIGQGYNNFTMLQLAHAMATLANGGIKYTPHLTLATENVVTRQRTPLGAGVPVNLGYKRENIDVVLRAMQGVTTEGTSTRVFAGAGYESGGKTGTAQAVTIGQKDRYDARKLEEHQRDHALYIAFAPVNNPRVAVAVVVENAGFGAAHAAPIARRVFDYLLLDQYPNPEDLKAVQLGQAAAPIGTPLKASAMPWPPLTPLTSPATAP
ncbi:MAG TPA: penicillin-binding protein 2 [Hydrogenophaga sp.]|jgi:penicillin-binding protein 2|uniref:penicillin-binding protein 2 n=1 Tax=Hydrogenophaga sp. TaxID=1904254 RepID=UPI0008C99629|nr:penicillin-binding protein 2 [Hydrogenophaga sp.]MBW8471148.1 penicillin-binding protein 2 [Thiobacillus sp.]OGA78304.1 MAG: penicillin-binding protein 2 [Burkholderiales bacterium GWE1_65_30]OGA93081.1 MAG: penicillin-binding protein 2 [Burkholderiales bacterium GWF1_66_17]PKO74486.1 MAG: penicillin-binding protein 2 [Betaproteobacteria bacterium HGW-Betaproteobacteria-15]HAX19195.1 penicillin-binding protein 2 [Hydrogenophaga sp.]